MIGDDPNLTRQPEPPKEVKKTKPGWATKIALLQVIERKRLSRAVDYKSIALEHGISPGSLKAIYYRWTKGWVDMGAPETPEERAIDARVQMDKKLILMRRYQALILSRFEGAIFDAEAQMKKDNPNAWIDLGLPRILNELRNVDNLINRTEEGYVAIVEEYRAQERSREKQINITPQQPRSIEFSVVNANEEAAAIAALDAIR